MKKIMVAIMLLMFLLSLTACSGSSSSSYQLHDKNGNINWEYYNDMQDYFERNPDKLP